MRKLLIITGSMLLVLVGLIAGFAFWPAAHYDMAKVHPAIRGLAAPYRVVDAASVLDGGSVYIRIDDASGQSLILWTPVSYDGSRPDYSQLFIVTSKTNRAEIAYSEDTKRMLIATIDRHAKPSWERADALMKLRGWPRDYWQCYHAAYGWHLVDLCREIWDRIFVSHTRLDGRG